MKDHALPCHIGYTVDVSNVQAVSNRIIFCLALIGMEIAGYLTLAHSNLLSLVCGSIHGCDRVARHPSAHGFGIPALAMIPTAAFGLLYYVVMLLLCWALLGRVSAWLSWGISAVRWGMACAAVLLSLWLTLLEAYVIHGWCPWCLTSAGISLVIFSIASIEILLNGRPGHVDDTPHAPLLRHESGRMLALLLVILLADGVAVGIFRQVPKPVRLAQPAHNSIRTLLLSAGGYVRGNPSAPYTLVEFGNYACPHCQEGKAGVERILAEHAREMNYVFYYYPLADEATQPPPLAARAAEVAGLLGKFWEMHTLLFREEAQHGDISTHWLRATVRDLHLDDNHFEQLLTEQRVWRMISLEKAVAKSMQVDAVPSFILIGPDGQALRFTGYQALRHWFVANPAPYRLSPFSPLPRLNGGRTSKMLTYYRSDPCYAVY
jgi:protein-disulfide isomerase/uncharacterized membrane protein